jgi:hypothetical protein
MRGRVAGQLVVVAGMLGVAACADGAGDSAAQPPATATTARVRAAAVVAGGTLSGTVREQMAVGPYVYLRLETAAGDEWSAVNAAPVHTGDSVTVYNVMRMEQFASQTLQRTFARIYFGSLDPNAGAGSSGADATGPNGLSGAADPLAGSPGTPAAVNAEVGPVPRATGPNGRTIGDLYARASTLAGTTVAVRGVVVKYNAGVMGKNWIHLQDGSGDAGVGTHDVTATSLETAAVGDTVTVTGTVRTNKDFGAGYVYPLVLEDAKVTRRP